MRRYDRAALRRLAAATTRLVEAHNDDDRTPETWASAVTEYAAAVTSLLRQEIERGATLANEHAAEITGRSVRVSPDLPNPAVYMDGVRAELLSRGDPIPAARVAVYLRDMPAQVYRDTLRWATMVASVEEEMSNQ